MKKALSFLLAFAMTVAVMLVIVPPVEVSAATTYEFLFPVNNGGSIAFLYGYTSAYGSEFHRGIDIYAGTDQVIYAAFNGTVTWIANSCPCVSNPKNCPHTNSWGNCIQIKSEDGKFYGIYGHLKQNSMLVTNGQKVVKGQPIASMGSSGYSWEKHLHFELRTDPSNRDTSINVNPTNASQNKGLVNYSTTGYNYLKSDTVPEGIYKFNNDGYRMYTVSDKAAKGTLKTSTSSINSSFEFRIEKDGNYYKIFPKSGTTNCWNAWWSALGDGGTTYTNFAVDGDEVTLFTKANNDYSQKWIFEKCGDGYLIHPACTPAFSITREDNKLVVKKTTKASNQIWKLEGDCNHSYQYESNSTEHWQECTLCGDKQSSTSHSYTNNCDSYCDTCGYTRTITHTYDDACDPFCNTCGHVRITEHTYSNNCDTSCNVCGKTRTTSHSYSTSYSNNSDKHWRTCTVCGNKGSYAYHSFVITNGNTFYFNNCDTTCSTCGYERTVTHSYIDDCDTICDDCGKVREAEEEHAYVNPTPVDSSTHKVTCMGCKAVDIRQHVYTNDCDSSCNHCKYERTITHTYDNDCDTSCNVCGETRTVETLPSSTPDETEPSTKPSTEPDTKPNTNNTPSNSDKNGSNDDDDNNNTTIIIVAVAGAVTVSAVSIFGTALIMKKKR